MVHNFDAEIYKGNDTVQDVKEMSLPEELIEKIILLDKKHMAAAKLEPDAIAHPDAEDVQAAYANAKTEVERVKAEVDELLLALKRQNWKKLDFPYPIEYQGRMFEFNMDLVEIYYLTFHAPLTEQDLNHFLFLAAPDDLEREEKVKNIPQYILQHFFELQLKKLLIQVHEGFANRLENLEIYPNGLENIF